MAHKQIERDCAGVVRSLVASYPVITMTGPRQAGKTTLCRMVFGDMPYANLENPETRAFAVDDARAFLADFPNGAILDEFQRVPELTSHIQGLVDTPGFKGVFVLTGSQNLRVRDTVSQSLAGRTALVELLPFSLAEVRRYPGDRCTDDLVYRGFYPRIYDRDLDPTRAYADYVGTYVERDVRQLSMVRDLSIFQKFVGLCAGRIGQLLNLESLGNDTGIAQATAREWLSLLEASYLTFRLPPFSRNISKRLVKSPKLYFYDVGLAAYLIGITEPRQLRTHPLRGMLYENMVVVEVLKHFLNRGPRPHLFFYRDSNGNEVDLLVPRGGEWVPVEIKAAATANPAFFKGIERFMQAVPETADPMLVYDGDDDRTQRGIHILNAGNLTTALSRICKEDRRENPKTSR